MSTDINSQAHCLSTQPQEEPVTTLPTSGGDSAEKAKKTPSIWGRLVSCHPDFGHVDLIEREIFFGRNPKRCKVVFTDPTVSGLHCCIARDDSSANTSVTVNSALNSSTSGHQIRIIDHSTNGTFVKGSILGKGKTTFLLNGDLVSFTSPAVHSNLSFIFQDLSVPDQDSNEDLEINKHYIIQGILGTGNFSVVKKCVKRDTGESYAVKIIDKMKYWHLSKNKNQTFSEISILKQIQHPNIISIIEIFDTERYLYIILELATGGELFDKIKEKIRFSEPEAKDVFKQILDAVSYLHQLNISHRDLKPENILIGKLPNGESIIKVTDFGLAKIIGEKEIATTLCGTPLYVAPEILKSCLSGSSSTGGYGKEVDAWSLGCILYILLSGKPPFDADRSIQFQQKQGDFTFNIPIWNSVTDSAKDLIQRLLKVDPAQRISVKDALNHKWFSDELHRANTVVSTPSPDSKKFIHHIIQLPIQSHSPNKSFTLNQFQNCSNNNNNSNGKSTGGGLLLQFENSPPSTNKQPTQKKNKILTRGKPVLAFHQSPSQTINPASNNIPKNLNNNYNNNNNLLSKFKTIQKKSDDKSEINNNNSNNNNNQDEDDEDEIDELVDDPDDVENDTKKRKKSQIIDTRSTKRSVIQKKLKSSK